jgi:hypothetical protein
MTGYLEVNRDDRIISVLPINRSKAENSALTGKWLRVISMNLAPSES